MLQSLDLINFLPPLFGAIAGVVLKYIYDRIAEHLQFKKELKDNNYIDVTGEWYAAWQTSVDGSELINTEHLKIEQKGKIIKIENTERSPENPKAGYLWNGQLQFFQGKNVMGWYFPKKEESNSSKGMLYMIYISQRKIFFGKWVGTGYDGDLINGFVVISKERDIARRELEEFMRRHPQDIRLIFYDGV